MNSFQKLLILNSTGRISTGMSVKIDVAIEIWYNLEAIVKSRISWYIL